MKDLLNLLPQKPIISKKFEYIPVRKDYVLAKSMFRTIGLHGRSVSEVLPPLLEIADGTKTIEEISKSLPSVTREVLVEAFELLMRQGLLEEGDGEIVRELKSGRSIGRQEQFFKQIGDPARFEGLLKKSKITLVGLNQESLHILGSLLGSGIRFVKLIHGPLNGEEEGQDLLKKAEQIIEDSDHEVIVDLISMERNHLDPLLLQGDLSIICIDGPYIYPLRILNKLHLALGTPWISTHMIEGGRWVVGPTVIPWVTACFHCCELRSLGNRTRPSLEKAVQDYFEGHQREGSWGGMEPIDRIIGGFVAMEAIKFLTRFAYPMTINGIITFNIFTLEMELNPVLRLPRCPSCGKGTRAPGKKIWQL